MISPVKAIASSKMGFAVSQIEEISELCDDKISQLHDDSKMSELHSEKVSELASKKSQASIKPKTINMDDMNDMMAHLNRK